MQRTQSLPLAFRSLDVERRTQPIPLVMCPRRGQATAAGTCGQCSAFERIEFTPESQPVVCCTHARARGLTRPSVVHELVRLPEACAALETPIARLLAELACAPSAEVVPVLDRKAKPRGFVTGALLEHALGAGARLDSPLEQVMLPFLSRVLPGTRMSDALRMLDASVPQPHALVAIAFDGSLLGMISAGDLSRADAG